MKARLAEARSAVTKRRARWRKLAAIGPVAAVPRLLRLGERYAPDAAARLAVWAWSQLPPRVNAERRRKWATPGGIAVAATVGQPASRRATRTVVGTRFGDPDRPIAWLMHGWGGWRQQLEPLVGTLVDAGYQVITHDALSHGDSSPGRAGRRSTSGPEMGETLADLARQWGQPELVIAHSLGAQASVWAHQYHGLDYRRLILVAPSVTIDDMVSRFTALVPLGPRVDERFQRLVRRSLGQSSFVHTADDFDLTTRAATHQMPVLVVHDENDQETPLASSRRLVDAWPDADLVTTTRLGHYRLLRSPKLQDAVATWLAAHPLD